MNLPTMIVSLIAIPFAFMIGLAFGFAVLRLFRPLIERMWNWATDDGDEDGTK